MGPQKQLNAYLKSVADLPFKWGQNDCLTFTNGAWQAMHGQGWADDWIGRYMKRTSYGNRLMRKDELRVEFGFLTFAEAVDQRLTRVDHIPPRGSLVIAKQAMGGGIGYSMGICVGAKAAFLSRAGVIYKSVTDISEAWI